MRLKAPLRLEAIAVVLTLLTTSFLPSASAQTLTPVPGATVTASARNGYGSAISGASGAFFITEGLGSDNYTVRVSAAGFVSAVLERVPIHARNETDIGDVLLQPSGIVRGRVTGPAGETIAGAQVSITLGSEVKGVTVTGSDGSFTFNMDLVNGTYKVSASAFSYAALSFEPVNLGFITILVPRMEGGQAFAEGYTVGEVPGVNVVQGQVTSGVEIRLDRSGIISGQVGEKGTGNPISGLLVVAFKPNSTYGFFGVTGSDGRYRIANNLPTGTYNVTLLFPRGYVWNFNDAKAVNVTAGVETANVDFELERSGVISGLVVYSDGAPAPNATVMASSEAGYFGFNATGYDGSFRIESGLGTGNYTLFALGAEGGFTLQPVEVPVEAGKETAGVRITLPTTGRGQALIQGRVTDSQGNPLSEANVFELQMVEGSVTDKDGRYQLAVRLPSGVQTAQANLTAFKPGYTPQFRSVPVEAGKTTVGVDFTLLRAPSGTLKGRVVAVALKETAQLSLMISATSTHVGQTVNITGTLTPSRPGRVSLMVSKDAGAFLNLTEVNLQNGAFSCAYTPSEEGTYRFKAAWPGDDEYAPAESEVVSLTVTKPPKTSTSITCTASPSSLSYGEKVRVSGQIAPSVANADVALEYRRPDGSSSGETVRTDSTGTYSHEYTPNQLGLWSVEASWPGDDEHLGARSEAARFSVIKVRTTISASASKSTLTEGEEITVSGSIVPSPGAVTVTLTYTKPDGTTTTRTVTTAAGAYTDTWKPTPKGSWSVKASWVGSETHDGATSSTVSFTVKEKGCIIATSTYGSELSPEVQYLRAFRDEVVLSTFAGSQFMQLFNAWYYSFSPGVVGFIAEQPVVKSAMKIALYPLIGILHLSALTHSVLGFSNEVGVVMTGLVASGLIGVVYFSLPVAVLLLAFKRLRRVFTIDRVTLLATPWALSLALIVIGEVSPQPTIMMAATGMFVLTTLTLSAAIVAVGIVGLVQGWRRAKR